MIIQKIDWLGEEEAFVELCEDNITITAFCHPCRYTVGEEVPGPLYPLDCTIVTTEEENPQPRCDCENHIVVGRVVRGKEMSVRVGGIEIEVGRMPGDIADGDMVELTYNRMDLY